jgi:hypothetical protein
MGVSQRDEIVHKQNKVLALLSAKFIFNQALAFLLKTLSEQCNKIADAKNQVVH